MISDKEKLAKYYIRDRRINIDPTHRCIKSQYGTFYVGDKVRYTDEIIDLANAGDIKSIKLNNLYKSIWQKKFMVIVGFDGEDEEIALTGYTDKLTGEFNTDIVHLSGVQLVTEAELLLYDD